MKKVFILSLFFTLANLGHAQVSGYMGKRFSVGVNMGLGLPFIGSIFEGEGLKLTPRFLAHGEYQVGRFYSLKAEVGFSNTALAFNYQGSQVEEFKQPTTMVIIGARKGKGMPMPISSSYFGYGIGMMFSSTPEFSNGFAELYPKESVSTFLINLEWGRRYVFENGIYIDGRAAMNIGFGLFNGQSNFDFDFFYNSSNLTDYVKFQMSSSALFDIQFGVGYIL